VIRCLVVTITRNRRGEAVRRENLVSTDVLTIGRSAQSAIHLPDPRVRLKHGAIRSTAAGYLLEDSDGSGASLNPYLEGGRRRPPREGLSVGPYELTPVRSSDAGHDFELQVELVQPIPESIDGLRQRSGLSLSSTRLSKRWPAWALIALVTGVFLVLPIDQARKSWKATTAVADPAKPVGVRGIAWDAAWDPGPLGLAHQQLQRKCTTCHTEAFALVPDAPCLKCHASIGDHTAVAATQTAVFGGTRCASCHLDHKGENGLVRSDATLCVDCHKDLRAKHPSTRFPNIRDFATDHPPFALSVVNAATAKVDRVKPEDLKSYVESSGLKFTHAKHLDPKGVRAPSGLRVLDCDTCHKPDQEGARFQPLKMEAICSECHLLQFEPAVTKRSVPHGSPETALATLREFYSLIALGETPIDVTVVDGLLRRPSGGAPEVERQRARDWAEAKALAVAKDLFEVRVCFQCHQVSRVTPDPPTGPQWTIAPTKLTSRWLPGSAFSHKPHQVAKCETCHDIRGSKKSGDISMPKLETCRTCHTGSTLLPGKVRSTCELCHSFHQRPTSRKPATAAKAPVA